VEAGAAAAEIDFDVLDVFGGFATLEARSPTLGGSLALRATQGCGPLLEGNAFGRALVIHHALRLQRTLRGWGPEPDRVWQRLEQARRAALPMLAAQQQLDLRAWPMLGEGVVVRSGKHVRLWPGLLVRPRAGRWVLIDGHANRRNRAFLVRPSVAPDPDHWVPLVLDLEPAPQVRTIDCVGEMASIAAVRPNMGFRRVPLTSRPDIAQGHLAFYEQDYFEQKKLGKITKRYRRTIDATPTERLGEGPVEIVEVGPTPGEVEVQTTCLLPSGHHEHVPAVYGRLCRFRFDAPIDFAFAYDGHNLRIEIERETLMKHAPVIHHAFARATGGDPLATHPGALLYLTKFVTPHPPGEPHFFVKPWAFTATPAGWSSVVDGIPTPEYDIMRGVVHTDQFFATPAVFHVFSLHQRIRVNAGQPLLHVTPIPRTLLGSTLAATTLPGVDRF